MCTLRKEAEQICLSHEQSGDHMTTTATIPAPVKQAIPGPPDSALFSNLHKLQENQLAFLTAMARTYGDVVRYRLAHLVIYQISHPEGAARILQGNHKNYHIKGVPGFKTLKLVFGNGLITIDGDRWLRQRRLVQPQFRHSQVVPLGDMMVASAQSVVDSWLARPDQGPIEMNTEMSLLTLRNIVQALFSRDIVDNAAYLDKMTQELAEIVSERFANPLYPPLAIPTPGNRKFIAHRAVFDEVVYASINQRRIARERGETFHDLLELLINVRDEKTGQGLSEKDLRDEITTFTSAGSGTATQALTWSIYEVARHPEVEEQLRAEHASVLGDRMPTAMDLPKLPYTRAVIDEAMRVYSPVWVLTRRSVGEDVIMGHRIPANANLLVSPYVIHRDPRFWDDPAAFRPERFLPGNDANRHAYAYFPFGGGPRLCVGKDFALVETQLILATIMQRARLELVPGHPVEPYTRAAGLHPRYGLMMTVHPRP